MGQLPPHWDGHGALLSAHSPHCTQYPLGSSPQNNGACSSMVTSDNGTKDDSSMSSYSVLSAGSHEEDKLHCEDIGEDTVLVRSSQGRATLSRNSSLD